MRVPRTEADAFALLVKSVVVAAVVVALVLILQRVV